MAPTLRAEIRLDRGVSKRGGELERERDSAKEACRLLSRDYSDLLYIRHRPCDRVTVSYD